MLGFVPFPKKHRFQSEAEVSASLCSALIYMEVVMTQTPKSDFRLQGLDQLMRKAALDRDFRALCLTAPQQAASQLGIQLPEGFELRFVENQGADMTLVLPDLIENQTIAEKDFQEVGVTCTFNSMGPGARSCTTSSLVPPPRPGGGGAHDRD